MADMREIAAKFEEVLQTGDFGALTKLTQEYSTDDFVQEWPQSGERLTKANSMKLLESYGEMSGTSPTFKYGGVLGGGGGFLFKGPIGYGEGIPARPGGSARRPH